MNIQIRNGEIRDIDQISKIEFETYGNYGWSKNIFLNELSNPNSKYLVLELNKPIIQIVAYIGSWILLDEGHITTLVVFSKYRRKHFADILLYSLISEFINKGIKWLTLEVKVSNLPAINLYKKFGFKELGIRKNYYQDSNEDALILWSENIQDPDYKKEIKGIMSHLENKIPHTDKLQYAT